MPKLAAFPKAFMQALCKDGTMQVSEWIELAAKLDIDGLEWYAGFLEMRDEKNWLLFRRQVENHGLRIPMMCCSPDFTHPDKSFRKKEIEKEKRWIDMTHALGDPIAVYFQVSEDPVFLLKKVYGSQRKASRPVCLMRKNVALR